MIEAVEIRNGYYWPKTDVRCWQYMMNHPNLPTIVTEYVSKKIERRSFRRGEMQGSIRSSLHHCLKMYTHSNQIG